MVRKVEMEGIKVSDPEREEVGVSVEERRSKRFYVFHGMGARQAGIDLALVVVLGLMIVSFSIASAGKEIIVSNLINIVDIASILGVITVGEVIVMIAGGLDISVGSTAGLVTATMAEVMAHNQFNLALGIVVAIATGLLAGILNGAMVAYARVNSVIATLGTYSAFLGLALVVTDGVHVGVINGALATFGTGGVERIPYLVMLLVVVVLCAVFVMRYTLFGHSIYAVGGSSNAASAAGIRVQRYLFITFVISGVMAAVGGIMLVGQTGTALPSEGTVGIELTAITAVLLGGTGLTGGTGTVAGAILAVLVLSTLQNGLLLLGVPSFWQDVATGVLLVIAVLAQDWPSHKERIEMDLRRRRRRRAIGVPEFQ